MVRAHLPHLRSPCSEELRALYRPPTAREIRQLVLEIVRLRALFDAVESYRAVVQRCWRGCWRPTGRVEKLRVLMIEERSRGGN